MNENPQLKESKTLIKYSQTATFSAIYVVIVILLTLMIPLLRIINLRIGLETLLITILAFVATPLTTIWSILIAQILLFIYLPTYTSLFYPIYLLLVGTYYCGLKQLFLNKNPNHIHSKLLSGLIATLLFLLLFSLPLLKITEIIKFSTLSSFIISYSLYLITFITVLFFYFQNTKIKNNKKRYKSFLLLNIVIFGIFLQTIISAITITYIDQSTFLIEKFFSVFFLRIAKSPLDIYLHLGIAYPIIRKFLI